MNNDGDVQFADRIIEDVDWSEFDIVAGVNALCRKSAEISKANGFAEVSLPEAVALMHSELSEALEENRSGRRYDEVYYNGYTLSSFDTQKKPEGVPIELADCVIRIADFCGKYGINLGEAIVEKLAYNKTRPFKHGKQY